LPFHKQLHFYHIGIIISLAMNEINDSPSNAEILIVDDMLPNLHLFSSMLSSQGYRVREAADGLSALKSVQDSPPDLILLDVRMPGMDGYAVCKQLKADERWRNIPVIFVSALDEQTDKVQGFSVGGVDYITKPFHIHEVLARVETHITLRKLQRQLEQQNAQLQQEIAERMHAEQALHAVNEALEQRVQERTAELAQAIQKLHAELNERRRAEAERERLLAQIRAQAQQVREIMNTAPEGVLLIEEDGRVILANPVAQKNLKTLADVGVGDMLTHLAGIPLEQLLLAPATGEWREVQADGQIFEVIARPVAGESDPQRWVMLIRDVTHERETQRLLQQQDRLAAVGQLAAGIAHDFNNILAVIVLYADMAQNTPGISERLLERLQVITQQSRRASELIQQILDFTRQSVLERRPMDLLPFIKEQVKLLQRTLPENIQIELLAPPEEFIVEADPTRMQQMILNLAANARDAMPMGGQLAIRIAKMDSKEGVHCVACGAVEEGDWISIEFQDSGDGISSKDLPYIFEPFYTTKGPGKGTGLGLAQVFGIVKSHNGHIAVYSRPGFGAKFSIFLPTILSEPLRSPDTDPTSLVRGRGQTILVVEDEEATRHALIEGLNLINYHAVAAANGRQALEYIRQRPALVDVVLSDVVMPEMGGAALYRAVRGEGLNIPFIMMTGHPIQKEDEMPEADSTLIWLQKPPRLKQLSQAIAQALYR